MVVSFPFAIGAGVFGVLALLFIGVAGDVGGWMHKVGEGFQARIDRADMAVKPEEFALMVFGVGVVAWIALALAVHTELLISILMLPLSLAIAILGGQVYLKVRGDRRIDRFVQQLEMVLRMLSGALRVGLGLRQAVILVTEEAPDPARREFLRVVGKTNIGIGMLDALDQLAKSMPSQEVQMFARCVRVQSASGGYLAKVLERLAATIRDRRRVFRKMSSLTAQGRFGAGIIGALPLLVGAFIVFAEPEMGHALLHTKPGIIALMIFAALETMALFSLNRILQFDV